MLDYFSTSVQQFGPCPQAHSHALEDIFLLVAGYRATGFCATALQYTGAAGRGVGVIGDLHLPMLASELRKQISARRTGVDVSDRIISKLVLTGKSVVHGLATFRPRNMRNDSGLLASFQVLDCKYPPSATTSI